MKQDLSLTGLPKEKVMVTVIRLMDLAQKIHFHFQGKSGKLHELDLQNQRLTAIVKRCRDLPGYELFQYLDETGAHVGLDSGMVKEYLHQTTNEDITAKDFPTWHGTVYAAQQLGAYGKPDTETGAKRNIVAAIKAVAEPLGNRSATCRKYCVHPLVLELYVAGQLKKSMTARNRSSNFADLAPAERCVLQMLLATVPKPSRSLRLREK